LSTKKKAIVSWSGGKDSALALHEFLKNKDYEISALLTTVTEGYDRTSMHGVRRVLLEEQINSLGFSLEKVFISKNTSNEEYESKMRDTLQKYKNAGISSVVFGDIFLEDLRKYREKKLSRAGMDAIFPIWKRDTTELARTFIKLGFKAIVTCVDSKLLDGKFAGRIFDEEFLSELPSSVDPCGENGEFHSFVYDGPIFQKGIGYKKGEVVLRDKRFYYCDLIPYRNEIRLTGLVKSATI
jgi:uncharacterized protein (TIGR00290 family)